MVPLLLIVCHATRQGLDVNERDARDWFRWNALHFATLQPFPAIVELLLHRGADADAPDWDHWTALHWAAYVGRRGHVAVAKALVRYMARKRVLDRFVIGLKSVSVMKTLC